MATHSSAIKRNRQNARKRMINQVRRTRIRTLTKEILGAVEAGNPEEAREALHRAIPVIQRAAARGTIHRNAAFRKVSRLTRRVNAIHSEQ